MIFYKQHFKEFWYEPGTGGVGIRSVDTGKRRWFGSQAQIVMLDGHPSKLYPLWVSTRTIPSEYR
jgi:hypothetical protein